jgi:hypothetical protein
VPDQDIIDYLNDLAKTDKLLASNIGGLYKQISSINGYMKEGFGTIQSMLSQEPEIRGRPKQLVDMLERARYINVPAKDESGINDDIENYFFGNNLHAQSILGTQKDDITPVGKVNHPSPLDITSMFYPVSILAKLGENVYDTLKAYSRPASADIELPDSLGKADNMFNVYDMIMKSSLTDAQKNEALEYSLPGWFTGKKAQTPTPAPTQATTQTPIKPAAPASTSYSSHRTRRTNTSKKPTQTRTAGKSGVKGNVGPNYRKPNYNRGNKQNIEDSFNIKGDDNYIGSIEVSNGDNYKMKSAKDMKKVLEVLYKWNKKK